MQVLVVLLVLGWLTTLPAIVWWALLGIVLVGLAAVGYSVFAIGDRVSLPWQRHATFDPSYVAALVEMVSEAQTEAERLRAEVERLRSNAVVSEPDPNAALYNRVGLSPGAPVWLIDAARKAFRTALHPDRHPAHRKQEAEKKFKLAEGVFDQIAAQD